MKVRSPNPSLAPGNQTVAKGFYPVNPVHPVQCFHGGPGRKWRQDEQDGQDAGMQGSRTDKRRWCKNFLKVESQNPNPSLAPSNQTVAKGFYPVNPVHPVQCFHGGPGRKWRQDEQDGQDGQDAGMGDQTKFHSRDLAFISG